MQETGFHSWVRKIPWSRQWQTHSSILAWRIPWTEEPGGLQSMGLSQTQLNNWTHTHTHTHTHTLPNSMLLALMAFSPSVPAKVVPAGGERSSLRRVGTVGFWCFPFCGWAILPHPHPHLSGHIFFQSLLFPNRGIQCPLAPRSGSPKLPSLCPFQAKY